jgi:hypothetical protein
MKEVRFGAGVFGHPCSIHYFKIGTLKASGMTSCTLVVLYISEQYVAPISTVEIVEGRRR